MASNPHHYLFLQATLINTFTESRGELSEPFWFNITEEVIFYTVLDFSICIKYRESAKCFTNMCGRSYPESLQYEKADGE